ncbi:hypothetical protein [Flagellimonas sp.]|uniref:hypothetical protein n=1 Tax=Flagellimonas sp. TaxID=2058762 RepID=UPI003BA89FCC
MIFKYIKKRIRAISMGIPFKYKNVWYNQSIHSNELYPEVVDSNGKYTPCRVGEMVVMAHDAKENPIYYRITSAWVRDGADPEHPSDAWMCDLEFDGVEKGPKQPSAFLGDRTDKGGKKSRNDSISIANQLNN